MLREGWNVTIVQSSQQHDSISESNDCEKSKPLETASIQIEIQITDSHGNPVNHFNKSFNLTLFGTLKNQQPSACLGYRSRGDADWSCDESKTNMQWTKVDSVYMVSSSFDHLTSFAVLLGESNSVNCGWGWIEYASMGIIGGSIMLVTLAISLYYYSGQFRVLLRGQDERKALSSIEKKIKLRARSAPSQSQYQKGNISNV